jgi:hypothetical protein
MTETSLQQYTLQYTHFFTVILLKPELTAVLSVSKTFSTKAYRRCAYVYRQP